MLIVTAGFGKRIPPSVNDPASADEFGAALATNPIRGHKMYPIFIGSGDNYIFSNLLSPFRPIGWKS